MVDLECPVFWALRKTYLWKRKAYLCTMTFGLAHVLYSLLICHMCISWLVKDPLLWKDPLWIWFNFAKIVAFVGIISNLWKTKLSNLMKIILIFSDVSGIKVYRRYRNLSLFVKVHLLWVWYYKRSMHYLPDSLCVTDTDRGHGSDTGLSSCQVATNIITPILRTQKLGSVPDLSGRSPPLPCLWQLGVAIMAIISCIIHQFADVLQPFLPGIRLANFLECVLRVMTFRVAPDVLSVKVHFIFVQQMYVVSRLYVVITLLICLWSFEVMRKFRSVDRK